MKRLFLLAIVLFSAAELLAQQPRPIKPRILVSTDIGGTDPDDNQSMIHLLMYNDWFDLEGLVSSPSYGQGSKEEILRMIDLYEKDYPKLKANCPGLLSPDSLRALCKQGRKGRAPYKGYAEPTEGSDWIVQCARRASDRPLWVLVWGTTEDLAQALHDAPDIAEKIRVYYIGGPNKKWGINSYTYIAENFPDLWMIENNSSYRGFITNNKVLELSEKFSGGEEISPDHYGKAYYDDVIRGCGAMGAAFKDWYDGIVKMGDTPSLLYMMDGNPEDPTAQSWGGTFERISRSSRRVFHRTLSSQKDTVPVFSIMEMHLRGPKLDIPADSACFRATIAGQVWDGYYLGRGDYVLRYSPKEPAVLTYSISSDIPGINGVKGSFVVTDPWPGKPSKDDLPLGDKWYSDMQARGMYEDGWQGAMTVYSGRKEVLDDWAGRWAWLKVPQLVQGNGWKRDDYEFSYDIPKYVETLKQELTYPLAWQNNRDMSFDAWKEKARARVFEQMMTPPKAAESFDPEIIAEEQRNGYRAVKIRFNVNAYSRVTAYMLVPDGEGPFPTVNLLHDHGAHLFIGKEKMIRPFGESPIVEEDAQAWADNLYEGQFVGDYLAAHGYACFSMDAPMWGERGREEGVDRSMYDIIAGNMMELGRDLCAFMHYDDIASTEFLATLPFVDKDRIGCMGCSMGAYRAWMLSALSDRIKAGAAVCWMVTTDTQLTKKFGRRENGGFANCIPGLRAYMDYPHIASIAAPKPMLFISGRQDKLFPVEGVERAFATMQEVWASQDADDALDTELWDIPHSCHKDAQSKVLEFFNKHL